MAGAPRTASTATLLVCGVVVRLVAVRLVVVGLLAGSLAGLLTGCGAAAESPAQRTLPAAEPSSAPQGGPPPAGTVLALEGAATAVAVDPRTGTVAVALADPPRLELTALDDAASPGQEPGVLRQAPVTQRQVPLPGPAADLVLAAEGGPLLVSIREPGTLMRVPLDGGPPTRTTVDGAVRDAMTVGNHTVVALGDRLTVLDEAARDGDGVVVRTIPGFADAARLAPAGNQVAVLDLGRTALSLVDPASGTVGPTLRAGNGAVRAVADRFDRILVTDVRDGELLVFAADPLLLRQRFPLPGAPYGLAYDARRDLAWVTLTARNEVVGLDVVGGEPVVVHRFATVDQPDAVAVDPVSGRVLVVSASGAGLQVINPEERVVR